MTISVPATSANLGPGFDSLGLSLDFHNSFEITPASEISIEIYGEGEGVARLVADNMFVRIFYETLKNLGYQKESFHFVFKNQIPISRGMGSSSAVIVGAISAAYHIAGLGIKKDEILSNALMYEKHPDNITPAVFGGFNVSVLESINRTPKILHLTHQMPSYLRAVMVIPNHSILTKYARQALPRKYQTSDVVFNLSRASLLTMAIINEKWELLRIASKDRLHQYKRMQQFPILFSVQKYALENGALMSTLSGSGSSFFNLCLEDDAKRLNDALQERFYKFRVITLKLDNEGIKLQ